MNNLASLSSLFSFSCLQVCCFGSVSSMSLSTAVFYLVLISYSVYILLVTVGPNPKYTVYINPIFVCLCVCEQGRQPMDVYLLCVQSTVALLGSAGKGSSNVLPDLRTHAGEHAV